MQCFNAIGYNMDRDLYIYGAGGHAKVVAATARLLGYQVKGFCEDHSVRIGELFFGAPIVPFEQIPHGANVFIAFGNNSVRYQKITELKKTFNIPTLIHPSAQVASDIKIGCGCFIEALSNIDPDCQLGTGCILNKLSNISHDSVVGAGTHVAGGVIVAGNVNIGKCCCIGIGSRIIEKITIGDNVTVGAGAVVIRDLPANVIAVGVPAKIIK